MGLAMEVLGAVGRSRYALTAGGKKLEGESRLGIVISIIPERVVMVLLP
jgi:hypothetical protein